MTVGRKRISKKDWYDLGGFANSDLFRVQKRGVWHYFISV